MGLTKGTRAKRAVKIAGLLGVVAIAASGCSKAEVIGFGWPKGVTPQADAMRELWTWSCIAALIIGVLVWGATIWTVIFHRKKKGDSELPRQFQYNLSLETVLTVIPVIIVAILFYFTTVTQNYILKLGKPDVRVNVTAFQWNWDFAYPDYKTPQGQPVHTIGSSSEIPLLVLPTEKTVQYKLRSNDVIHSFFVPDFHFKRDVFPDPEKNNQHDKFQNSIDQPGSFVGRCAELCGTYHSMMNFEVRALPDNLFTQYMRLRTQNNPSTGQPYTAPEALSKMHCGKLCTPHAVTTQPFDTGRTLRAPQGVGGSRDANQ
ncbi:MAG: aa3-type cytochrome oxidase subunit II [Sciscionella sp.]